MPEPFRYLGESQLLSAFLRAARLAYTGETRPTGHKKHRQVPLSQAEVAERINVSLTTISLWERGKPIPVGQLDNVAEAYCLSAAQRDELWLMRTGDYPPAGPGAPDPDAVSGWTDYLSALQVPGLVIDRAWNIVETNQTWNALFEPAGQQLPTNLLRFILFSPYARALCGDWAEGWVRPFLHELRLEPERNVAPALRRIISELLRNRELAHLWKEAGAPAPAALHGDGQVRLIKPPASECLHSVRLLVSSPAHNPRRRVILLIPTRENTMTASNMPSAPSNDLSTLIWLPAAPQATAA